MGNTIYINENQLKLIIEGLSKKVYHFTSLYATYKILTSDTMYCQAAFAGSGADSMSNKKFYISTTRNKTPYEGFGYHSHGGCRIELDGDKLNSNFEGKPVNYWGSSDVLNNKYSYIRKAEKGIKHPSGEMYGDIQHHTDDEMEDRLFTNKSKIENISKYINRVDILLDEKDIEEKSKFLKYAVYMSMYFRNVFLYDDEKAFSLQTDKTINDKFKDYYDSSNVEYSLTQDRYNNGFRNAAGLISNMCALWLLYNGEYNIRQCASKVGKFLSDNGLNKYIREVIKHIKNDYGYSDVRSIINTIDANSHNMSKTPTEDGQNALEFIGKILNKWGCNTWRDVLKMFKEKENQNNSNNIDTDVVKDFTVLTINGYDYKRFDITDLSNTNIWYILELETKEERYRFVDNVMYWLEDNGHIYATRGGDKERFRKFMYNLTYKDISIEEINNIFGKINLDFFRLLDYADITYKVFHVSADYYSFRRKDIYPAKNLGGETEYDNVSKYEKMVFSK